MIRASVIGHDRLRFWIPGQIVLIFTSAPQVQPVMPGYRDSHVAGAS